MRCWLVRWDQKLVRLFDFRSLMYDAMVIPDSRRSASHTCTKYTMHDDITVRENANV